MTRASFAGTDLSSLFASIGKEAAAASAKTAGSSGGNAAIVAPVNTYSAPKTSAEQAAEDNDMYDQWANGLIGDDEWLAYIAKRVAQTSGNSKEHEKWVKYQRKYTTSIADNKMQYAYEQGDITLDDLIAYQRKALSGMDQDSQEWRERNASLTKMIDERAQGDIVLRAQNMTADIANGKATYDDLISLYRDGLKTAKPGTTWYDKLNAGILQAQSDKTANEFNGGAEEIQYLFEAGKISGNEAGKRIRSLADQYLKGDKQNYYKTLQTALGYEKYGSGAGVSGSGGSGGGGRGRGSSTLPTLSDTYLESAWRAANKFITVANTPDEGPSYVSNTAGKALMEIDRATAFLVQHPYRGSKTARTELEKIRKDILAAAKTSNTLSAQDKLRSVVMTHAGAINAAIHDGAADGGASVIKAITDLNSDLAPLVNSLGVDQYGNMTGAPGVNRETGFSNVPQKPNEWQVADANKMAEAFAIYNWTNEVLMVANSEQGLTDEQVKELAKSGSSVWFTEKDKQKYSAEPEFAISGGTIVPISWDAIAKAAAEAAQDVPGIRNNTRVPVRYADGTASVVPMTTVPGPFSPSGASTEISQLDGKALGIAPDSILVPVLEKNADGTTSVVMTEANPYMMSGVSTVQANTTVKIGGVTYKKDDYIPADAWAKVEDQKGLISTRNVTIIDSAPVDGWYSYHTSDGSAYAFNRLDGSTICTGRRGAEYVPFKPVSGTVGEYANGGGSITAESVIPNPMLTTVPIGLGAGVSSDEAATFLSTNPSMSGATSIIDADGKQDFVEQADPSLATRYSDRMRPGERAYLDGSPERIGSGAFAAPTETPNEPGDLTGISARFGIRGLGPMTRDFSTRKWDQQVASGPTVTEAMPALVGARYTHTGPRITGRVPSTAPKVSAAPVVNAATGFDVSTHANAATGFSVYGSPSLPPSGKTAISVPTPTGARGPIKTATPPPASLKVTLPKTTKKKKTSASGGAVGNTKVAS